MGVKGLWSVLRPAAKQISIDDLKGVKVGIDGPFWMAQAKSTCNDIRRLFHVRIVKLRQVGVKSVVAVFDGKIKPDLKLATLQERRYNRARYDKKKRMRTMFTFLFRPSVHISNASLSSASMDFLGGLGVSSRRCSGESDSLLAEMNASGAIDAIISDDVDGFLFGARRIIRGFSIVSKKLMASYDMRDIEARLNLNRDKFVALGLLCGNDYDPKGLPGVGLKRAYDFVKVVPNEGSVVARLKGWKALLTRAASAVQSVEKPAGTRKSKRLGGKDRDAAGGAPPPVINLDGLRSCPDLSDVFVAELPLMVSAYRRADFPDEAVIDAFLRPKNLFAEREAKPKEENPLGGDSDGDDRASSKDPKRPWLVDRVGEAEETKSKKAFCLACGASLDERDYRDHVTKEHLNDCRVILERLK